MNNNYSSKVVAITEIIVQRRKKLKLKTKDMASKLGIHIRTYQRREAGNMTIDELSDICAILDLTFVIVGKDQIC